MSPNERRRPHHGAPSTTAHTATDRVTPGADIIVSRHARSIRVRKFARRQLDELLGQVDPWSYSTPVDYHQVGLDLTVPERQYRGEELLAAGWTP